MNLFKANMVFLGHNILMMGYNVKETDAKADRCTGDIK